MADEGSGVDEVGADGRLRDGGARAALQLLRAGQAQVAPAAPAQRLRGIDLAVWRRGAGRAAAVPVRVSSVRHGQQVRTSSAVDPRGTVDLVVTVLGGTTTVRGWLRPAWLGGPPVVGTDDPSPDVAGQSPGGRLPVVAGPDVLAALLDGALWLATQPRCACGEHTVPLVVGHPAAATAAASRQGWCELGGCMVGDPAHDGVVAVCRSCGHGVDAAGRPAGALARSG